jgi:hypothetical protein
MWPTSLWHLVHDNAPAESAKCAGSIVAVISA